MKVYVTEEGDTLAKIAKKYKIELEKFISINKHIANPDVFIAGICINIPTDITPIRNLINISPCPPAAEPSEYLDHWIPLTPLEKMAETEYDVLIVGTGAGGGATLWRLCEKWGRNGKRIGVVEAGGLLLPTHHWNIPTFNSERAGRYFTNPKISYPIGQSLPEFSGAKEVFALGGRTLFWGGVSPRLHKSELLNWPVTIKEMELYYNIAEQVMNVTTSYAKDSSFTKVLLHRLWENGFPEAGNNPVAVDLDPTQYGEIHSNVAFSSISFLAKALNHKPFDLAVKARAVQVLTDKGKAVGVRVMTPEKRSFVIKAHTVVLAANTFETPRLLLYSDIPGKAIGHYLTNHSFLIAKGSVNTENFPEVLGVLGILIPQTEDRPFQIQIQGPRLYYWYHDQVKPALQEWEFDFFGGFGKVESRFENRVSLDPSRRDEYGVPHIQVNFSYSERDQDVIRQTASGMMKAVSATGIQLAEKNGQPDICLVPPGADFHESGTCRMGDDPANSVTNRYGQIHNISGLYVADNSVLPSIGAANPTLTTVALAIRTADYIVGKSK